VGARNRKKKIDGANCDNGEIVDERMTCNFGRMRRFYAMFYGGLMVKLFRGIYKKWAAGREKPIFGVPYEDKKEVSNQLP